MKIILTGGDSGGHFYPLIAVAQEINKVVKERKMLKPKIYFLSNSPYNKKCYLRMILNLKKFLQEN